MLTLSRLRFVSTSRHYSSAVLSDRRYTKSHEWIKIQNNIGTVGITDHAQSELGDVVFVELPEVGKTLKQGETFGAVESVKAASDLYLPVGGKIVETNSKLGNSPNLVNEAPNEEGWMVKIEISNSDETKALLTPQDYEKLLGQSSE